jgi:hypothetical protein
VILTLLACTSTEPVPPAIPVFRYSHSGGMWDGQLYTVGGSGLGGKDERNNGWSYDLDAGAWTERSPPPRLVFRASWAIADGVAFVHAGSVDPDNLDTDQLLTWDLASDTWTTRAQSNPKPSPRFKEAATYTGERILTYGGQYDDDEETVTFGELWSLDPSTLEWEELTHTGGPGELTRVALAWDEARGVVWLCGGIDPDGERHGWLWQLDPSDWTWTLVSDDGEGPGPRASHTLALVDGVLHVWGGNHDDDSVWAYDPDTGAWTEIPNVDGPPGRDAQVTGVTDTGFVIFAGDPYREDIPHFTNDVWSFDASAQSWTELEPWSEE